MFNDNVSGAARGGSAPRRAAAERGAGGHPKAGARQLAGAAGAGAGTVTPSLAHRLEPTTIGAPGFRFLCLFIIYRG